MANMQKLGRRLRLLRESADISQVELSKETGISQNYISSLELGKIQSPSMELLCILGKRFGMSPNDLATYAEWWSPPRRDPSKIPADLQWAVERLAELPASERKTLTTVLRQMVSASYRESHGHAPPPAEL